MKIQATRGARITHKGKTYEADKRGVLEIADDFAPHLARHGFSVLRDEPPEEKGAKDERESAE